MPKNTSKHENNLEKVQKIDFYVPKMVKIQISTSLKKPISRIPTSSNIASFAYIFWPNRSPPQLKTFKKKKNKNDFKKKGVNTSILQSIHQSTVVFLDRSLNPFHFKWFSLPMGNRPNFRILKKTKLEQTLDLKLETFDVVLRLSVLLKLKSYLFASIYLHISQFFRGADAFPV